MLRGQPSDKDVFERVDNTFDVLESERAKGLHRLKALHAIINDGAARERNRLMAKYGTEHARVKKLGDRLTYNEGASRELDVEIEQAHIEVPPFDVNTWMVHGRVLDKEGKSISGLTVSLYDTQGTWVEELGYACTDDRGYYAIRYKIDPEKKPKIPETEELLLTVTNSEFKVLHREKEPLFVIIGQIDFRLIVLDDEGAVCVPPEPGGDQAGDVPSDVWLVRGRVAYKSGEPGRSLTVSLYDKEHIFDDRLGTTVTDEDGHFMMTYKTEDFRDLIEKRPDIYLKVFGEGGKTLYSSRKAVKYNAGHENVFHVKIKKR